MLKFKENIEEIAAWISGAALCVFVSLIAGVVLLASTWPIWAIAIGVHFALKWW